MINQLVNNIKKLDAPIVVGLDPMLDYVQHSILMGNGTPSLRSHVEYVTTDILDDGIENALVHYNLIP